MIYGTDTHSLNWEDNIIHTWRLMPQQPRADLPVVVMLHGAGTADSTRAHGIASVFAQNGLTVISLDFVGHGKTGGDITTMSLARRTKLAQAVIKHWTKPDEQLILCGFSMSGHTALRLTTSLGSRVAAISLMAPGIYTQAAEDVVFGAAFSDLIRVENSWQDSLALQDAAKFTGRVHMLMSNHDQVIPWGVPEHLLKAFRSKAAEVRFDVVADPDHRVAVWLSRQPDRCQDILRYLLGDRP